jgi:hypothetical protein
MKIKTSELTGDALDWAVNQIEECCDDPHTPFFSTNWAQGGPIIEREEISISREFSAGGIEWAAWTPAPIRDDAEAFGYGPTPLIAAMRCFVASKLGDEIEVPEELK